MTTENQNSTEGSAFRATAWMFALSLPLGLFVPALGHFIAGVVGGRIAKRVAWAATAAAITSVFWASGLLIACVGGIHLKNDVLYLPPILAIAPPLALFSGALTGAQGKATKVAGLVMLIVAVTVTYRILAPYRAAASQFQVPQSADESARGKACPDNLRQLHKAALLYADAWDDTLPPADRWMDLIKENVPDDKQLHCPTVAGPSAYGYAMNTALGGKKWKEVADAAHQPLFYDSSDLKANAHDAVTSLPSPGRHAGHNNVVYLDGRLGQK